MSAANHNDDTTDITAAAPSLSHPPPSIANNASRYRPSKRRKSQTYQQHTHSCNSLYSLTTPAAGALSTGAARTRPELASTVSAAAQLQSIGARRDGRSVPNVNFYIPPEDDGRRTGVSVASVGRQSTIDRARVNLNLSLKNVCSPAPRSSTDGGGSGRADGASVVTSISTNSSGAMAKDLLDAHDADVDADAEERGKRSDAGLIGALRSWSDKFRRWRSCVSRNAGSGGDRKQSMNASMAAGGSGRGREASVASVMGAEKSQQSTSSRILRAFSHVGEPEGVGGRVLYTFC